MLVVFQKIHEVHELAANLSMFYNIPVIPGRTLLFRDEIQKSADAIQSLWSFKEDYPELHVVAAGSLLEFALQEIPSFGVGRIHSLFVYPFSFDEFLVAEGKADWVKAKQGASAEKPLLAPLYNDLVQHFRTFLMVGGMPASVEAWVTTHDYSQCQAELDDMPIGLLGKPLHGVFAGRQVRIAVAEVKGLPRQTRIPSIIKAVFMDKHLIYNVLSIKTA